jgi:energy-converting hydrogenase A subunit R
VFILFEKSFITDCEGPLTLNDNAYELCNYFIEDGDKLFKILSLYDDYLVDIVKKPNYNAGNTLKLIIPFFISYGIKNQDLINYSKDNVFPVKNSKETLSFFKDKMNRFIVSTSYGQYIEAVADFMDFPFENTYYTNMDLDSIKITETEIEKINEFRKIIINLDSNKKEDVEILDNIFFNEIPKLSFFKSISAINIVGGKGKELAIKDIIKNENINPKKIIYVGDSITDSEPLKFTRQNNGLAISFNGNEYPLDVAEIAIVSDDSSPIAIIGEIFTNYNKEEVLQFIREYNVSTNLDNLFEKFNIKQRFKNQNYPIIKIITKENKEEILLASSKMRKNIRGKDIGGLG